MRVDFVSFCLFLVASFVLSKELVRACMYILGLSVQSR